MDRWADEESSPIPVHGRECRKKALRKEEGSSLRFGKESFEGGVFCLTRESLSWIIP
jgi:hypothetical protein